MTVENNLSHTKQDSAHFVLNTETCVRNKYTSLTTLWHVHGIFKGDVIQFIIQFLLKSISDLTQDYLKLNFNVMGNGVGYMYQEGVCI